MADTSSQYLTKDNKMAIPLKPDKTAERSAASGYLFTPPENTFDSFSQDEEQKYAEQALGGWQRIAASLPPITQTPPESPRTSALPSIASATGHASLDTPLFPHQTHVDPTRAQTPLFGGDPAVESSPLAQPASTVSWPASQRPSSVPSSSNSFVVTASTFTSHIKTRDDIYQYWKDNMAEIREMRRLPTPTKSHPHSVRDPESQRQINSLRASGGITKSRSSTKAAAKPKAPVATSPVKTSPPKRRSAPKPRNSVSDFLDNGWPAKESSTKHKRAPPSKKVEGENIDWRNMFDYAPPTNDLDENPTKKLKVVWPGAPLDLRSDPTQSEMHPQEVRIASDLRLSGESYMTNKRKIFEARVKFLKESRNFTKTAAQNTCKIDVNKASQLWDAFDKVGWFNPEWFQKYL